MALRYEFAFDIARFGALAVKTTDETGTQEIVLSSGLYIHTTIASVHSLYTAFAAALATALNASSPGAGTFTVTWNGSTGYTIAYDNDADWQLTFSTTTVAANGTRMKQVLGMTGDRTGAASYSSQCRPYFVLLPAIQGRSQMSDEYEPDGIVQESVGDDGQIAALVAVETSERWMDWQQAAETETAPSTFSDNGTPPYKRQATAAVPWTYQHAWEHHRTGFDPILVIDGSSSDVTQMRADGASFRPRRMAGDDFGVWQIPFRVRLLGRL